LVVDRPRPAIARSRPNCRPERRTSAQARILTVRRIRQLGPVHTHHTRWGGPGPARARLRGQGTHQKSKNTKTLKR
jgi:hypothetical protein